MPRFTPLLLVLCLISLISLVSVSARSPLLEKMGSGPNGNGQLWNYDLHVAPCGVFGPCPPHNGISFSFWVNGTNIAIPMSAPSISIAVGDTVQLNIPQGSHHPLTLCINSDVFCTNTGGTLNALGGPITTAGDHIMYTFMAPGTAYYGCNVHMGMGGTITII